MNTRTVDLVLVFHHQERIILDVTTTSNKAISQFFCLSVMLNVLRMDPLAYENLTEGSIRQ